MVTAGNNILNILPRLLVYKHTYGVMYASGG